MEEKKFKLVGSKKTRYLLPNLLTIVGVCLGISSIKFSIDQNFNLAVIFILLAPALIIYFWELNTFGKLGWTITLLYSVCCVLRLARFNLTNINKNEVWKMNYFEGIPSPIGAILILLPLIYEISDLKQFFNPKILVPYITILVSIMLISKIPTFSFKKISVPPKLTIFILLFAVLSFVSLMFYTFETLLLFGFIYVLTIPLSAFMFLKNKNSLKDNFNDDDHEDIL